LTTEVSIFLLNRLNRVQRWHDYYIDALRECNNMYIGTNNPYVLATRPKSSN